MKKTKCKGRGKKRVLTEDPSPTQVVEDSTCCFSSTQLTQNSTGKFVPNFSKKAKTTSKVITATQVHQLPPPQSPSNDAWKCMSQPISSFTDSLLQTNNEFSLCGVNLPPPQANSSPLNEVSKEVPPATISNNSSSSCDGIQSNTVADSSDLIDASSPTSSVTEAIPKPTQQLEPSSVDTDGIVPVDSDPNDNSPVDSCLGPTVNANQPIDLSGNHNGDRSYLDPNDGSNPVGLVPDPGSSSDEEVIVISDIQNNSVPLPQHGLSQPECDSLSHNDVQHTHSSNEDEKIGQDDNKEQAQRNIEVNDQGHVPTDQSCTDHHGDGSMQQEHIPPPTEPVNDISTQKDVSLSLESRQENIMLTTVGEDGIGELALQQLDDSLTLQDIDDMYLDLDDFNAFPDKPIPYKAADINARVVDRSVLSGQDNKRFLLNLSNSNKHIKSNTEGEISPFSDLGIAGSITNHNQPLHDQTKLLEGLVNELSILNQQLIKFKQNMKLTGKQRNQVTNYAYR